VLRFPGAVSYSLYLLRAVVLATERAAAGTGQGEKRPDERLGSIHGQGQRAGGHGGGMSERTERSEGHERMRKVGTA
jgi:hypothetical protein